MAATRNGPRNIDLCYFLGQVLSSFFEKGLVFRTSHVLIVIIRATSWLLSWPSKSWSSMIIYFSRTSSQAMCDATQTGRMAPMMGWRGKKQKLVMMMMIRRRRRRRISHLLESASVSMGWPANFSILYLGDINVLLNKYCSNICNILKHQCSNIEMPN